MTPEKQAYMRAYNKAYREANYVLTRQKRQARKRAIIAYKGGKCERCGYDRCMAALQFHHRDPKQKTRQIAVMLSWAWARIMDEVDKCDLVCANCHAETHFKEEEAR